MAFIIRQVNSRNEGFIRDQPEHICYLIENTAVAQIATPTNVLSLPGLQWPVGSTPLPAFPAAHEGIKLIRLAFKAATAVTVTIAGQVSPADSLYTLTNSSNSIAEERGYPGGFAGYITLPNLPMFISTSGVINELRLVFGWEKI
jgi:hypothetical protein